MNSKLLSIITPLGLAAGLTAGISAPAFAQEVPEHGVFILNSVLFLMSGFLVMFMACGFCMLEAGLVRQKIPQPSSPRTLRYSRLPRLAIIWSAII